jgi:hypothetical protein
LVLDENNVKTMFRMAQALNSMKQYDKAKQTLEGAKKIDPTNNEILSELKRSAQLEEAERKKEKQMYSKMFS